MHPHHVVDNILIAAPQILGIVYDYPNREPVTYLQSIAHNLSLSEY